MTTVSEMFALGELTNNLVLSSSPQLVTDDHVGIEVEVENVRVYLGNNGIDPWWDNIDDGSLRNGGREFVFSQPMFGQDIVNALEALNMSLSPTGCEYTERCSVHVHVNVRDMTFDQIANMTVLYALAEPLFFAKVDDARERNFYCKPLSVSHDYINKLNCMFFPVEDAEQEGEQSVVIDDPVPEAYMECPEGLEYDEETDTVEVYADEVGRKRFIRMNHDMGLPYYGQRKVRPAWTFVEEIDWGYFEDNILDRVAPSCRVLLLGESTRYDLSPTLRELSETNTLFRALNPGSFSTTYGGSIRPTRDAAREQHDAFRSNVMEGMKYYAYNVRPIQSLGTIEFRHHHGTHDPAKILDWVNTILSVKKTAMGLSGVITADEIDAWVNGGSLADRLLQMFSEVEIPDGAIERCVLKATRVAKTLTMSSVNAYVDTFEEPVDTVSSLRITQMHPNVRFSASSVRSLLNIGTRVPHYEIILGD